MIGACLFTEGCPYECLSSLSCMTGTQDTGGSTRSGARKKQKVSKRDYYGAEEEETQANPDDDVGVHERV